MSTTYPQGTGTNCPQFPLRGLGRHVTILLVTALVCASGAALTSKPQDISGYLRNAIGFVSHGTLQADFLPAGYTEFIAAGIALSPHHPGIAAVVMQVLLHAVVALTTFTLLRLLRVPPTASLITSLVLQLHPELILSVTKIWDVPFSIELLLLIVLCSLLVIQREANLILILILGASIGWGAFGRPNMAPLALVGLYVLWTQRARLGVRCWTYAVALLVVSGIVYTAASFVAFHRLNGPHNGPYNSYAGNNAYAAQYLLSDLNAEPSIYPALRAEGRADLIPRVEDDDVQPQLSQLTVQYLKQHPTAQFKLMPVKLFTYLRPDTKVHPLLSRQGIVKGILALFVPAWVVILLLKRKLLDSGDYLIVLAATVYSLPFLITNADPRFRIPLDLLSLIHGLSLLLRDRAVVPCEDLV